MTKKGISEILQNLRIKKSITQKMIATFLSISILPILFVGFLSVNDASNLGDDILENSEKTKISTTTYLNDTLTGRQESFFRNFTIEKADEYANLFLQIESFAQTIANFAVFVMEDEGLKTHSIDYSSVWFSPPFENYNEKNDENWSFQENELYPYNDTIQKGLIILELIKFLVDENEAVTLGYFAFPERITLLYPSVTGVLLEISSDLYPPARPWYEKALTSNSPVWTDPYIEATKATMTVTATMAVRDDNDEVVGVVGLDVFLDDFRNDVLETEQELKGKAFVINDKKEVIVASWLDYFSISETGIFPSVEEKGDESFKSAIQAMAEQRSGYEVVVMEGENYYLSFAPIVNLNLSLGILFSMEEVLNPIYTINNEIDNNLEDSEERAEEKVNDMETKLVFITLLLILLIGGVAVFFAQKMVSPIKDLKNYIEKVGKGDLDGKIEITTGDELEIVGNAYNTMVEDLKLQMKRLEKTTREKEKIEQELQIAHDIQKSFLPSIPTEIEGYQFAGVNIPAREVGGDFYDFIQLGDNKTGIVIADVSGKGVPAALFMGIYKTLVRANVKRRLDPIQALAEANSIILEDSDSGMFITLFYAILDNKNHKLTFINAGHNPPIMVRKKGRETTLLKAKGIPLGVMEDLKLELKEIIFEENEMLFLYTDGVTEAVNEQDEEFGTNRLIQLLNQAEVTSPDQVIEIVTREVKQFTGEKEQFDDITMVVLQSKVKEK